MYTIHETKEFKKSYQRLKHGGASSAGLKKLREVVELLASGTMLPVNYRDHALQGNMKGIRECHIQGDLLLVYSIQQDILVLALLDIGSHSYLFG